MISFNDVEIPAENLLGEENKGFKLAMMTLDRTRPGVAAMAVGIARAAFEFAARLLQGARAVRRADRDAPGDPVHDRRHGDQDRGRAAAHLEVGRRCSTRASATRSSPRTPSASPRTPRWRSTVDAVQVYGGYGFIKEYPVEKLMRDAKIMQLYEGTSQIQRLVIAREVLMPRRVEEPAAAAAVVRRNSARQRWRARDPDRSRQAVRDAVAQAGGHRSSAVARRQARAGPVHRRAAPARGRCRCSCCT